MGEGGCKCISQLHSFESTLICPYVGIVLKLGDITFRPAATACTPVNVVTYSRTQALKVAVVCANTDCTNNAYLMKIRFGQPSTSKTISSRILKTFSCSTLLRYRPAATALPSTTDPQARIVRVVLVYGKHTFNHDAQPPFPGEPQMDHLVVSIPATLPPSPKPAAPLDASSEASCNARTGSGAGIRSNPRVTPFPPFERQGGHPPCIRSQQLFANRSSLEFSIF